MRVLRCCTANFVGTCAVLTQWLREELGAALSTVHDCHTPLEQCDMVTVETRLLRR